jgi:hypothetical protein
MLRNAILLAAGIIMMFGPMTAAGSEFGIMTNKLALQVITKPVRQVYVTVNDQVSDGCLPNPKILGNKAELILRQSGIQVASEFPASKLLITALGYEMPLGDCAVSLAIELEQHLGPPESIPLQLLIFQDFYLTTGSKGLVQGRLVEYVDSSVTDLANEILEARQQ